MIGTVKFYDANRGFGFIVSGAGETFFHVSHYHGDPSELQPGAEVEFTLAEGRKGLMAVAIMSTNGNGGNHEQ